jgi:hypothetical protein
VAAALATSARAADSIVYAEVLPVSAPIVTVPTLRMAEPAAAEDQSSRIVPPLAVTQPV